VKTALAFSKLKQRVSVHNKARVGEVTRPHPFWINKEAKTSDVKSDYPHKQTMISTSQIRDYMIDDSTVYDVNMQLDEYQHIISKIQQPSTTTHSKF
jgi:hypothetical protein